VHRKFRICSLSYQEVNYVPLDEITVGLRCQRAEGRRIRAEADLHALILNHGSW